MFLTFEEMSELTGRKQKKKQVEQLLLMHIPFSIDALGRPKVLRKVIEEDLGAEGNYKNRSKLSISYDKLSTIGKV
ncbi:DUF4224 domain-containing protein [Bowmanella yangjiangensis]|uniref:DUF4224 domain-containing protein n=1 Tax=Bowmanella yangjiangensis TaxID=2811230 RepID=A0ABS3CQG0_9ALTE|nr:DUF4224 domain-containing protein [Bowmanella yangjiangensis]MBN7819333.1 DUF4224 domain-containing protein [Bowmanella yangjiangensis]